MIDAIRANAEMTVEMLAPLAGGEFGYDEKSVRWLDGYIERLRASGEFAEPGSSDKLVSVFGSYLGECIIRSFGGAWLQDDGNWCVAFDAGNRAYPFAKVRKQIENGPDDSIAGFYTAIPFLFSGRPPLALPEKRPWWKFWG